MPGPRPLARRGVHQRWTEEETGSHGERKKESEKTDMHKGEEEQEEASTISEISKTRWGRPVRWRFNYDIMNCSKGGFVTEIKTCWYCWETDFLRVSWMNWHEDSKLNTVRKFSPCLHPTWWRGSCPFPQSAWLDWLDAVWARCTQLTHTNMFQLSMSQ